MKGLLPFHLSPFTSLLAYWYAKSAEKDTGPLVMLGGFVGSIIGENIVEHLQDKEKK